MESKLPEIPSEYIEPYLAKFMGNVIEMAAFAYTEEELKKKGGVGHTIPQLKEWVKGVEFFVSSCCGIHSRYAMMNELDRLRKIPDDEFKKIAREVFFGEQK